MCETEQLGGSNSRANFSLMGGNRHLVQMPWVFSVGSKYVSETVRWN